MTLSALFLHTLRPFFFLLGLAVAGLVLVAAPSNHLSRDLPYPLLFSAAFAFGGAQFTPNPSAKNFATCDYECLKWNSAGVCTNIDDEGRSQVDCGKTAKPGGINLDIGIVIFSMIFMKASNLGVDAIMKRAGQRPNKCWGCFSLAFLCTFPAPIQIPHSYSDMVCLPSPRLRASLQYQPCEAYCSNCIMSHYSLTHVFLTTPTATVLYRRIRARRACPLHHLRPNSHEQRHRERSARQRTPFLHDHVYPRLWKS